MRIRIATDTQLTYELPIRILGARLVHTGATTVDMYDEADSSKTAATKKIALATTTTVLSDSDVSKKGVLFSTGCYIDWNAGELFLDIE